MTSARHVEELIFAGLIAALGAFILVQTGSIYSPPTNVLGPRTMPYVVGIGLTVLGLLLVAQVLRGKLGAAEQSEDVDATSSTKWSTVACLVAVLVVHAQLIEPFGWPVAAVVLFAGATFALGGRRWVLTVVISVVLALTLQFLMAHVMGLGLPAGPLLEGVAVLHG